jgi:hypothetical protein
MSAADRFIAWLREQGCTVEVTQPDDGGGYVVMDVETPDGAAYDLTVQTSHPR